MDLFVISIANIFYFLAIYSYLFPIFLAGLLKFSLSSQVVSNVFLCA